MEKATNKFIYETTVLKQVEEKVPESRVENGEKIEVIKTIKKAKPFKIAVRRPDRKTAKEAEIFYAKRLSHYLKEGLLPHSLVIKRYLNDGGPLSDDEKSLVQSLRENYIKLQEEYFAMKSPLTDAQNERRAAIILELNEINTTLRDIQNNYSEIFSNTAEAKSKADLIEWWILFLSYANLDEKELAPLFGEGDFAAKMKALEVLEGKEDIFINEVIKKLSYFISFWHTAGPDIALDDFKSAEENYNLSVTEYVVEEEKKEEAKEGVVPNVPGPDGQLLIQPPVNPIPAA
jgi:hypothetical protein